MKLPFFKAKPPEYYKSSFKTLARAFSYAQKGDIIVIQEPLISIVQFKKRLEEWCYKVHIEPLEEPRDCGDYVEVQVKKIR